MAESQSVADLFVSLGVKADPGALDTINRFDQFLKSAASSVRSFAKVGTAGAASIAALGASGASLAPLIAGLDALQDRIAALKTSGIKLPSAPTGATPSAGAEASLRATAKAADQQAASVEKARAKLETIGASASAVDKVTLAFRREQEAILAAAAATGDNDAATKALAASEAKHVAALAKIADGEKKAADNAAKMAMEERKAAQDSSLFGANNIANFTGAMGIAVGVIEQVAKVAAVAAASVVALGTALAANSLNVATNALATQRAADATGLSIEEYQRAAYALERYEVSAEKIPEILGKVATQATNAAAGSKDAAAAMATLGIDSAAYLKMKPAEQLAAVADGFAGISDPSLRAVTATKLLGDEMSRSLLPLLIKGSAGMDALGDSAQAMGLILSEDDVAASQVLTQQWAQLTGMVEGLRTRLGTSLIPVLSDLATRLIDWYDANKDVIDQKFEATVTVLAVAFDDLGLAVAALDRIFGGASGLFEFGDKLLAVTTYVWAVGVAIGAVASGPVAAIYSAFAVAGLAVQDFYTYLTGGQSVIGTLIDQFGQTDTLLGALIRAFQALGSVAGATFNLLTVAFGAAWDAAAPFRDLLSEIAGIAGGALLVSVQVLTAALTDFLNVLTMGLNGLAGLLGSSGAITGAKAVGATLGTGGAPGLVTAPAAGLLAASLAPTSAPAPISNAGATVQITVGGAQISGLGMSPEQVQSALSQHTDYQNRQIQQALIGANL